MHVSSWECVRAYEGRCRQRQEKNMNSSLLQEQSVVLTASHLLSLLDKWFPRLLGLAALGLWQLGVVW